jgi:acetyl esterase/lipase
VAPSLPRIAADTLRGGSRHRYADHRWAICELHVPRGDGPYPVAIVLHGGSWRAGYDRRVMRPVCRDLVRRGWAAWNVEYRRVGGGQGGGWPATFDDVSAAVDALPADDARLDLGRVVLLGHSAGGHLALWAAGRSRLPAGAPGAAPRTTPRAVIAQAPVANLERARALVEAGGAVNDLLGGSPSEVPERYDLANPFRQVPLAMPVLLVHGAEDQTVAVGQSRDYAEAARAAGGVVELVEPAGATHRDHLDPRSTAWAAVTSRLDGLAPKTF